MVRVKIKNIKLPSVQLVIVLSLYQYKSWYAIEISWMDFEKASSSDNIKSMIKAMYVWCDDFLFAKYRIRMTGMKRER